jgi:SAM-dependent methyltransferase
MTGMQDTTFHTILAELIAAASHDDSLVQFRMPVSGHQYLRLYQQVATYVRPGGRVLDWGSGNGHCSYFLVRAGYTVCGFDCGAAPTVCGAFTPGAYAYTQDGLGDPSALPYESESFDAVVSVGVLEHVRETGGDESASLNEIRRILKPDGIFLCFHLPNRYSWIEAALRSIGRWSHQYRFTASGILALAGGAGFEVVDVQRYGILPRNIWWWGMPKWMSASFGMARAYDGIDNVLSGVLAPVCQNYCFVARKRA